MTESKIDIIIDYFVWGIFYLVLGFLGGAMLAMIVVMFLCAFWLIPIGETMDAVIILTLPLGTICFGYLIKMYHEGREYKKHRSEILNNIIVKWQKQDLERKFGEEWLAVRTQVLKRDKYKCVNCGQTGAKLHVHHIIPVSAGGTDELNNLVTLCAKCHSVQDGKGHNLITEENSESLGYSSSAVMDMEDEEA